MVAFLAAVIVTVAGAQPGGFRFGPIDPTLAVIDNAALQEELKVTAAQKDKFKGVVEKRTELTKKRTELFAKGFKDIDKDALTKLNEDSTKLNEEIKKVVEGTLNADQKKRLKQINVQVMGLNVFADPDTKGGGGFGGKDRPAFNDAQKATIKEVNEALKLSETQTKSFRGIVTEFNKDQRDILKEVGFGKKADPDKRAEANK
ncbi:MAG: hypothetical protein L0241_21700 [Planctomycetia bacterium]|nr:hypothetical protein [Planctomycetia bacterium]